MLLNKILGSVSSVLDIFSKMNNISYIKISPLYSNVIVDDNYERLILDLSLLLKGHSRVEINKIDASFPNGEVVSPFIYSPATDTQEPFTPFTLIPNISKYISLVFFGQNTIPQYLKCKLYTDKKTYRKTLHPKK